VEFSTRVKQQKRRIYESTKQWAKSKQMFKQMFGLLTNNCAIFDLAIKKEQMFRRIDMNSQMITQTNIQKNSQMNSQMTVQMTVQKNAQMNDIRPKTCSTMRLVMVTRE
jgi:hypothetical protein